VLKSKWRLRRFLSSSKFVVEGHERGLQSEGMNDIFFVNETVSRLKALVDIGATHIFVSEWTITTVHYKPKRNMATYKVVNSVVKPKV
jgi:hypothetical protein